MHTDHILNLLCLALDVRDPIARRLVRKAALRLGRLQWHAEAPGPSPQRRAPSPTIIPISPADGAQSRGGRPKSRRGSTPAPGAVN
jgi:hypothetical protein